VALWLLFIIRVDAAHWWWGDPPTVALHYSTISVLSVVCDKVANKHISSVVNVLI